MGNFYCYVNRLESLEGAPKIVRGDFWCQWQRNGKVFSKEEIRAVCDVHGSIVNK